MINRLSHDDYLSLTIFNNQSKVILDLCKVSEIDTKKLIELIEQLKADGGTNFEKGYIGALNQYQ